MTESVRAANTAFILVSESSGSPVPLPFYTHDLSGNFVTVHDFVEETEARPARVVCRDQRANRVLLCPGQVDLRIITEAEYMEKQS